MKPILLGISLLLSLICSSQNTLTGSITDKSTGESLPGATIYLPDLQAGAIADDKGAFTLTKLPAGRFLLEARLLGYRSFITQVNLAGEKTLDIQLEHSAIEVSQVVVTGVSRSEQLNESPFAGDVITSAELQLATGNSVDAIADQPGVSQVTTGQAISKPIIRGLGYNRVVVLFDGLRQEGQQWGDEHGVEIATASFDQVEIIRGPGSLMYGSDAMAGVVNFIAPKPLPNGKMRTTAQVAFHTNGSGFDGGLQHRGTKSGLNWLVAGAARTSHPYHNPTDGDVFNSGFNEWSAEAGLGVSRKWGFTRFRFNAFNQKVGLMEGERDSLGNWIQEIFQGDSVIENAVSPDEVATFDMVTPFQHIAHYRFSTQNYFHIKGQSGVRLAAAFQHNLREEFEESPIEAGLIMGLSTVPYDVRLYLPSVSKFESTFGVNGMFQFNTNAGDEFLIPDYSLVDIGTYLVTKRRFGKANVSAGLRFDNRSMHGESLCFDSLGNVVNCVPPAEMRFDDFGLNFNNISGSVGVAYNFSEAFTAKLNLSRGFRAPNISELASNGIHEGTFRYEYGNTSLKAETSTQVDLGAIISGNHVTFELAGFVNSISNYIFIRKLSAAGGGDSIPDPTSGIPAWQYTQNAARLHGGEVAIDFHPHPLDWLHIGGDLGVVFGENLDRPDSSKYLPFIPPLRMQYEVKADLPSGKKLKSSFMAIEYEFHGAQNRFLAEGGTETATPSYSLLNASVGTTMHLKHVSLKLFVIGENLLDASYQDHLSRLKYAGENPLSGTTGIYNIGRNVSVKLIVPIES